MVRKKRQRRYAWEGLSAAILLVGCCAVVAEPVQFAKVEALPSYQILPLPDGYQVEVILEEQKSELPTRRIHLQYASQNLESNQMICLFLRSDSGEYWPIPAHQHMPRVLPINREATATVDLYGEPPSESFVVCFVALDERDQVRMRKWLLSDCEKGAFNMTSRAVELGRVSVP